ncbi:7439_t:CDS:10 [Ambispora gerdemannii]|uniref:7439_t:CDS:1 n=1 Tax=Ambispora gerdemannii TaxID=144530 RepID=A0A9N8VEZ4_9GLOM|nr:7439_t:CDS:10 [Ambispora gerdemannii]
MYVKTPSHDELPPPPYDEKALPLVQNPTSTASAESARNDVGLDTDNVTLLPVEFKNKPVFDEHKDTNYSSPNNTSLNNKIQTNSPPPPIDETIALMSCSSPENSTEILISPSSSTTPEIVCPAEKKLSDTSTTQMRHIKRIESAPNIPVVSISDVDGKVPLPSNKSMSNLQNNDDNRRNTLMINASSTETPKQYLERMQDTLSKTELTLLLAKNKDAFHEAVFQAYLDSFDFHEDPIDIALRKFLMECCLPKETQQIDRVIEAFAKRYHACNPSLFPSSDTAYVLAFSLLMLHTDAFNKSVKRKMTKEEFVKNSRIDGLPSEILEILYDNITFTQFIYAEDDTDVNGLKMMTSPAEYRHSKIFGSSKERKKTVRPKNDPYHVIQNKTHTDFTPTLRNVVPVENPYSYKGTLAEIDTFYLYRAFTNAHTIRITGVRARRNSNNALQPTSSSIHSLEEEEKGGTFLLKITKAGILNRKVDLLEGGKKATGFLRSWKQFGVILSGSQLMFFKDISWFKTQMTEFLDPSKVTKIPVLKPDVILMTADSITVYDKSYTKYVNVFRLVCPKGHQYLFEADCEEEMNDWIIKINYAAAFKTAGVKMRYTKCSNKERKRGRRSSITDSGKDVLGRPEAKTEDLQGKIATLTSQLNTDVRFIKNLVIMIPYKAATRDRILSVASGIGKRFKQTCLELTRLVCYHEIMEKDLCQSVMEDQDYWSRRKSTNKSGYERKYRGGTIKRERDIRSEYHNEIDRQNTASTCTLDLAHSADSSVTYSILVTPTLPSILGSNPPNFDSEMSDLFGLHTLNTNNDHIEREGKDHFRDDASSFIEIGFEDGRDLDNEQEIHPNNNTTFDETKGTIINSNNSSEGLKVLE